MGLTGERDALAIVDRYSDYKDCFPLMGRHAPDAQAALMEFFGNSMPKFVYTDMAPELIKAVKDLCTPHGKSTPYRHTSNSYCERVVRKVVEGARTLLEHAGLPTCFWPFAVRYWCFADNVAVRDGESAWNLRHQAGHFAPTWGKSVIPFGCLVEFLPKPDAIRAMPKFEPRSNQGILVGYRLQPGGEWAKDYQVFPLAYFTDYDYDRPRGLRQLIQFTLKR